MSDFGKVKKVEFVGSVCELSGFVAASPTSAVLHKYSISIGELISVKSLLESISTSPTHNEIRSTGRIKQRIIEPFEETFRFLVELNILFEWHYKSEKIDYYYEEFINLYVIFRVKDYPTRRKQVDLTGSANTNI